MAPFILFRYLHSVRIPIKIPNMDQIDQLLLGAWRGMNRRLRMDRPFAVRREARAFRVGLLRRPAWACCIALRASDTRLVEDVNALVDPVGGTACLDVHRLTIRGGELRDLVKPVYIPERDAIPASRACHLFGRPKEAIARWMTRGVLGVAYGNCTHSVTSRLAATYFGLLRHVSPRPSYNMRRRMTRRVHRKLDSSR